MYNILFYETSYSLDSERKGYKTQKCCKSLYEIKINFDHTTLFFDREHKYKYPVYVFITLYVIWGYEVFGKLPVANR